MNALFPQCLGNVLKNFSSIDVRDTNADFIRKNTIFICNLGALFRIQKVIHIWLYPDNIIQTYAKERSKTGKIKPKWSILQ